MKATVTGGSGFIGQHLCERLATLGHHVRSIQRGLWERGTPGIESLQLDIREGGSDLTGAFEDSDVIYHLAAVQPGTQKTRVLFDVNVQGTENVLCAAASCGVQRVIFVSSAEVYGTLPCNPCPEEVPLRPLTEYGFSKKLAEECCLRFMRQRGLEIIILRPGTVVGPGVRTKPILLLFEQIWRNSPLFFLGKGFNRIQLLSVHDLVDALTATLDITSTEDPMNVAAEGASSLRALSEGLKRHAKARSPTIALPPTPLKLLLRPLQALALWPSILPYFLRSDEDFVLDITRARKTLGFTPQHSNLEMLIEAYDWYGKQRTKAALGSRERDVAGAETVQTVDKADEPYRPHDQADHGEING